MFIKIPILPKLIDRVNKIPIKNPESFCRKWKNDPTIYMKKAEGIE